MVIVFLQGHKIAVTQNNAMMVLVELCIFLLHLFPS